jgi:formate dehydrogenase subunit delta
MNGHDIARMANQIAGFFAAYPHDEAVAGVARHIRDFWDPRMRARLADLMAAGGDGLSPLAREGAARVAAAGP